MDVLILMALIFLAGLIVGWNFLAQPKVVRGFLTRIGLVKE